MWVYDKPLDSEYISSCTSNEISLTKTYISTIYGHITDPHNDQLPVGPIAQLVEQLHRRSQGSSPVQAFYSLPLKYITAKIINIKNCFHLHFK